jgi:dipeptidyl aminopeptidase/acylaminoacyl peptidase
MFLVHEESDPVVPVSQSDDFVKALKEVGARDITYKRYSDGSGHGAFFRNMKETGPAREKFFERTLKKKTKKKSSTPTKRRTTESTDTRQED